MSDGEHFLWEKDENAHKNRRVKCSFWGSHCWVFELSSVLYANWIIKKPFRRIRYNVCGYSFSVKNDSQNTATEGVGMILARGLSCIFTMLDSVGPKYYISIFCSLNKSSTHNLADKKAVQIIKKSILKNYFPRKISANYDKIRIQYFQDIYFSFWAPIIEFSTL